MDFEDPDIEFYAFIKLEENLYVDLGNLLCEGVDYLGSKFVLKFFSEGVEPDGTGFDHHVCEISRESYTMHPTGDVSTFDFEIKRDIRLVKMQFFLNSQILKQAES